MHSIERLACALAVFPASISILTTAACLAATLPGQTPVAGTTSVTGVTGPAAEHSRPKGPNRVAGRVWLDEDRDGLQTTGEPGVEGVVVKLLDAYGRATGTSTATSNSGHYVFEGMANGEYRVAFERPNGRRFTRSDIGARDSGGRTIRPDTRSDDSDLNLANGYLDPTRRGPYETGMRYYELTRVDESSQPWPINSWVVYPAAAGSSAAPRARVRDLYFDDAADMTNNVATSKLATSVTGGNANDVTAADPDGVAQDIQARIDAEVSPDGPFPVVIVFSGLLGSAADMIEIGDQLASHGYVALCTESSAIHASLALGGRLIANGGIYSQSDFGHVPQISGGDLNTLINNGYQVEGYVTSAWMASTASQSIILHADAAFTLDQASDWNAKPGHPLEGRLRLEHVGWYGYSRGAGAASVAVNSDARVAFLMNIDSSTFVNVPKPMLWVGNHTNASTQGPSVQARLTGDFHPHYFLIPAIAFDPPSASSFYHREYHHDFRNTMITAFCGHYLKNVLAYREDLGLDGKVPLFDGYVEPYLTANVPGWHSEAIPIADGWTQEIDAGLVDVRMWVLEDNQLSAVTTGFLPAGPASGATKTAYGSVMLVQGRNLVAFGEPTVGLALDSDRRAWFTAGAMPALYELDLAAIELGAAVVATPRGLISGLPSPVHGLAYEPRGSRLLAIAGASARLYSFPATNSPAITDLGPLSSSIAAPAGLDVDARGRVWIGDASGESLTRISAGTGQVLGVQSVAGHDVGCIAYDEVSKRLFVVDAVTGELLSLDPENGVANSHGLLAALGLGRTPAIAFERRSTSLGLPCLDSDLAAVGGGAHALLQNVALDEPVSGWDGYLLRVQIGEGSGLRSDVVALVDSGLITLGARAEVELRHLLIGEAQEILWNGVHVGWLETDWDLAVGGTRLAPLRIALTAAATAPAVGDLVEALRYTGPLPRRFELELADADGNRNLSEVVELHPK